MFKVMLTALSFSAALLAAPGPLDQYNASLVPINVAENSFKTMRNDSKALSQCYNRAYVWSFELAKKNQIQSKKVLIYYTNKYRKLLDPDWGFHIAPVVAVDTTRENLSAPYPLESAATGPAMVGTILGKKGMAQAERAASNKPGLEMNMVMDRVFTSKPVTLSEWVEMFTHKGEDLLEVKRQEVLKDINHFEIKLAEARAARKNDKISYYIKEIREQELELSKRGLSKTTPADITCEVVEHITPFDDANELGESAEPWCFIQLVSQNYWNPIDLRSLAYEGVEVTAFDRAKLKTASREAFPNWRDIYKDEKDVSDATEKQIKEIEKNILAQIKAENKSYENEKEVLLKTLKNLQKEGRSTTSVQSQLSNLELRHKNALAKIETKKAALTTEVYRQEQVAREEMGI